MDTYTLVVSNPPHEKEVDAPRAAPCFGLTAADVGMKANYVAPEIWLAGTDRSKLEDAAQTLREAGLNIVIASGEDLAKIPAAATVKSFSFTDTYLVARLEDFEVGLPYDARILAVFCKAPEASPTELTRSIGSTLLDMYASRKGEPLRISFVQEVLDFSGLGDRQLPTAEANILLFVAECEQRFTKAQFDRRMVDVRLRRSLIIDTAAPPDKQRKGFSYATKALAKLLESISPDLKDISQFELGSRLAYPTKE
ncbi:MAG: hypothetical protein IH921_06640 [Gemmatimonadetes bacterium]|nr:hypothetical protein [Gemmatimonadota bacterium]